MTTYVVTAPDGKEYEVDAPEGATQAQALSYFQSNWKPEPTAQAYKVDDAFKQRSARTQWRAENPIKAGIADVAASGTEMTRGIMGRMFPEFFKTPEGLVNKDSWSSIGASALSPESIAIGGAAGKVAGAVLPRAIPAIQGAIGGALGGGAIGALSEEGDATTGALAGGAFGAAIPGAAKVVGKVSDLVRGRGGDIRAGRILRQAGGPDIQQRLAAAPAGPLNVAQAYGADAPVALAGVQRFADDQLAGAQRAANIAGQQEARRMALLQRNTPDLAAAQGARTATTDPMYKEAYRLDQMRREMAGMTGPTGGATRTGPLGVPVGVAPPPVVPEGFAKNPIIQAAVKQVKRMSDDPNANPLDSLEGMQLVKLAIDEQFASKSPSTPLARYGEGALKKAKERLLGVMEDISPKYEAARSKFAEMSPAVNQSKVMGELATTLKRSGGDGERATAYLNAMEQGAPQLLRRANQTQRFGGIGEILSPAQLAAAKQVGSELSRDRALKESAAAGGGAAGEILKRNMFGFTPPNMLNAQMTVMHRAVNFLGDKLNASTIEKLSQAMQDPRKAMQVIQTLPSSERSLILRAMQDPRISGAGAGMLTGATQ